MSGAIESRHLSELPLLRAYMLEPPRVEWADHPLLIPRRQTRALLYRLAASLAPVPREQLCFLFWPDVPESTARRALSHLLTHLRRVLPEPDALLIAEDCIGLDPRRAWSDAEAFKQLCAAEDLQLAVDLYRGPFLAGFSLPGSPEFEAWVNQERYAAERRYLEALAALMDRRAASGEYASAIACARRYLETDDLAEEVHRRLIELYAAAGDRGAALRQFERCAVILERELGVSPLPETRAVYQAILAHQPIPEQTAPLAWATLPSLHAPLVGRDEALRQLERAYARVQAGRGEVVLIAGEAGIGKSRLIQEFATSCTDRALILAGAGHPDTQTIPYQLVIEALRPALTVRPAAGNLQPVWLAEALRLLPELRSLYPDLLPPLPALPAEPEDARGRLFEALCQIVLGLALSPLVLYLDDLHWADSATLDWLVYLGRHLSGNHLLVIGAYRSEEADAVASLRHSLARLGILSEVKLAGLDAEAVLCLVRHLTPVFSPGAERQDKGEVFLANRLQKATGGNPFFLLETLRALIEAGRLPGTLADLEDLPLPDTVREAVEARLQRLSPQARQVLEIGAVLGPTFGFDLVRLTAGRGEMETTNGLDELVARQLLVEQTPGYRFQHELVRRAVEATLSSARRQLLHRRAGRALERLEPEAAPALARHFDAGGRRRRPCTTTVWQPSRPQRCSPGRRPRSTRVARWRCWSGSIPNADSQIAWLNAGKCWSLAPISAICKAGWRSGTPT